MTFFLWSGVTFVLFSFGFRLYAFVEDAALCSIVLRYAGVPIVIRVFFFNFSFFFVYLGMSLFPIFFLYHFRFLFVWRVRRTFFPSGWCFFYLVTTGRIFDISLCENLINQKNYRLCRAFGEEALCNLLLGDSKVKHARFITPPYTAGYPWVYKI